MAGDGNCWYRAIAHIVTGDQNNYQQVKDSVLQFMWVNIHHVQQAISLKPVYYLGTYEGQMPPYHDNIAWDVMRFHEQRNAWAHQIVLEMTAALVNTPYWMYNNFFWVQGNNPRFNICWNNRGNLTYPNDIAAADVPAATGLYIHHKNANHFNCLHSGVDS